MSKNQIHVFKQDNAWILKKLHSPRTLAKYKIKYKAIGMAVFYAKRDGNTEVIVIGDLND